MKKRITIVAAALFIGVIGASAYLAKRSIDKALDDEDWFVKASDFR